MALSIPFFKFFAKLFLRIEMPYHIHTASESFITITVISSVCPSLRRFFAVSARETAISSGAFSARERISEGIHYSPESVTPSVTITTISPADKIAQLSS